MDAGRPGPGRDTKPRPWDGRAERPGAAGLEPATAAAQSRAPLDPAPGQSSVCPGPLLVTVDRSPDAGRRPGSREQRRVQWEPHLTPKATVPHSRPHPCLPASGTDQGARCPGRASLSASRAKSRPLGPQSSALLSHCRPRPGVSHRRDHPQWGRVHVWEPPGPPGSSSPTWAGTPRSGSRCRCFSQSGRSRRSVRLPARALEPEW